MPEILRAEKRVGLHYTRVGTSGHANKELRNRDGTILGRQKPATAKVGLGLQREFPHRVLIEVGYVGNRGTGLGLGQEFNAVPAHYLST